jgi:uncharacterized protein YutE (UPF0331/DUF86 family)
MNPILTYHNRYQKIKKEKIDLLDTNRLLLLISNDATGLNNFFMAGLGLGTLIIRLGAVIQMCQKFEKLDDAGDALFMKQILDNLREILPSDTNWKNLWTISADDDIWKAPTIRSKNAESLLSRFVTFRNKYVHQQIKLEEPFFNQIVSSIQLMDEMSGLVSLFETGTLKMKKGKYYWVNKQDSICLYPYLQPSISSEDPYIFQGLYKNKSKAHLLNLRFGDEIEQNSEEHLDIVFKPLRDTIKSGIGQIFDHSERIAYYQSCFVGREKELRSLMDFCHKNDTKNMLSLKSPAGMGKGALVAELIEELRLQKSQVLYHFCGAGIQNNLHAVLYHIILQGNRLQYWDISDDDIRRKIERLPSKYIELIHFLQKLLAESFRVQKQNESGNLVILIDGLDEAQVAYTQFKIDDWFYRYNDKEEPEEDWRSNSNIRWIFTYRCSEDGNESFYKIYPFKELANIPNLQPLKGLDSDATKKALSKFSISDDFFKEVVIKSLIQNVL